MMNLQFFLSSFLSMSSSKQWWTCSFSCLLFSLYPLVNRVMNLQFYLSSFLSMSSSKRWWTCSFSCLPFSLCPLVNIDELAVLLVFLSLYVLQYLSKYDVTCIDVAMSLIVINWFSCSLWAPPSICNIQW